MKRHELLKLRINIVKNWKAKIHESGLSIPQLARAAGVSRQTIYHAVQEVTLPNVTTINKIEEVLNEKYM